MNHVRTLVAVLLAFSGAACAHTSGGATSLASARVTADAGASTVRPAMDGTCSVTEGSAVQTFTYVQGRLTLSTASEPAFRTIYTYEGARLSRIERIIQGRTAFLQDFRYDPNGRLDAIITLAPGSDPTTREESERRVFEYDGGGRVLRVTLIAPEREPSQVCVVGYDEHARVASYTCEAPGLDDEGPERTTYDYDATGRLAEVRSAYSALRLRYDASGLQQGIDALSESGDVVLSATMVRDANGRELERRTTTRGGETVVEVMAFEGTFGRGAECGAGPPAPRGLPEDVRAVWFEISP